MGDYMSKAETNVESTEKNKKMNILKNGLLIAVFLVVGLAIGIYGTNKYLEAKEKESSNSNQDNWPIEITNKSEYAENIKDLYAIVSGNSKFYTTVGVSYEKMSSAEKMTYIYNNLIANNIGENVNLDVPYFGSAVCNYDFLINAPESQFAVSTICTVIKINGEEFKKVATKLFNDNNIELINEFSPIDGKKCVSENGYYLCGNVTNYNNITGSLESKFEILKVTLDKDDTINIYDKGYLVDKRSNVANPDDGYDNYYLHSSDSTQYYYELKSADNLTFVHKFKKNDSGKYYYVSTSLYQE